jgi:hypothetical protein
MSERFKEAVLKTVAPFRGRGFESHSLRQANSGPTALTAGLIDRSYFRRRQDEDSRIPGEDTLG